MNKSTRYLLIILGITASSSSLATDTLAKLHNIQKNKNHVSLLFLQHASKISLIPTDNKCYKVTLQGLSNDIIYFSDEPARVVGKTSAQDFINVWQQTKIKPNAAVHGYVSKNHSSKTVDEILTFSAPSYNENKNIMSYTACPTQENVRAISEKTIYNATIFYDDFCVGCG